MSKKGRTTWLADTEVPVPHAKQRLKLKSHPPTSHKPKKRAAMEATALHGSCGGGIRARRASAYPQPTHQNMML